MKKISKKTFLLIMAVVVVVFGTVSCAPSYLVNKTIDGQRKDANLTIKSVEHS